MSFVLSAAAHAAAWGIALCVGNVNFERRWEADCPRGDHMPPAEIPSYPEAVLVGALVGATLETAGALTGALAGAFASTFSSTLASAIGGPLKSTTSNTVARAVRLLRGK
jgi:hypothetical protein